MPSTLRPQCWLVAAALTHALAASAAAFDALDDAVREADATYASQLDALAQWCRERNLQAEAKQTAAWQVKRTTDRFVIYRVADATTPPPANEKPPAGDAAEWSRRFHQLRQTRAAALFSLADDAAKARRKSFAYELLWETLREDENHPEARRRLGFENVDGRWAGPYAAKQLRAGRVWHERLGWIAKADVPRWEEGQRRAGDRWVTAEQDARRHADIRTPWQIETEHFLVSTNHSREEGVRLARDLERLHRAWRQIFVDYWLTDAEFDRMFGLVKPIGPQTTAVPRSSKYRVVYYRAREEYVRALAASQPGVAMSLGVYHDAGRAAHFFAGPEQHPATVFHEATHQLFKETRPTTKQPGQRHGMWLVEAAACYMESRREHEGFDTLGERDAGRFAAAVEKIDEGFYVRLADLAVMSAADLQQNPDVAKLYSQSAGLMTFLMHADGGRYRPAAAAALAAIYAGKATPRTLAEACQASYEALDEQYHQFVRAAKTR